MAALVNRLDGIDIETIKAMADGNMKRLRAAKLCFLSTSAMEFRYQRLLENTGLNCRNFYDLVKLVEMVKKQEAEDESNIT